MADLTHARIVAWPWFVTLLEAKGCHSPHSEPHVFALTKDYYSGNFEIGVNEI
ncbi:hypothetical protein K443DRAFT_682288 [Laccaria amethystina LaAM-08-1]|uniref:Uncharacterized protein n=1 Tax=Laccaria amethystina LaAM-08-1 TaxID=1095629 RepID=A0A0C9WVK0_9AGAR|nr:hypothetical protein K443DRAFT_682288 [Laccaria amethystina LaAM-08-1]